MQLLDPLDRPSKPALPQSYFWTWDHSTNWVLDDPGNQIGGSHNDYLKRPETYLEDYRRLSDFAAAIGVKGIAIFGFLRDSHGGVEYAKRVAAYGASRGVAIMPGLGVTTDGGPVFEGDHPYNLDVFLRQYPEARSLDANGQPIGGAACPLHPAYQAWLREGMQWLFREFEIGGLNLEVVDLAVDNHPLTRERRKSWPADDPEPYFFQGMGYSVVLDAVREQLSKYPINYASYTGFTPTKEFDSAYHMGPRPPAMLDVLPSEALCQWTLTTMVTDHALPLTAYLDDPAPAAAFENPNWPKGLKPNSRRSIGFIHQGSQWFSWTRHDCIISHIKEACLRCYRAGMEGVGIHGEVSYQHVPYALNYLAFSHFIHWPDDTLRDFGRKTMAQVLGSESEGERFAELLARWDGGTLTEDDRKDLDARSGGLFMSFRGDIRKLQRQRFWRWLWWMSRGRIEKHTASLFV